LSVGDLLYLAGSEVTTSVQGATRASNGGNIMITAHLTVLDHGDIVADANGGNIGMATGAFIASADSCATRASRSAAHPAARRCRRSRDKSASDHALRFLSQ
jgi:hypothetical protein